MESEGFAVNNTVCRGCWCLINMFMPTLKIHHGSIPVNEPVTSKAENLKYLLCVCWHRSNVSEPLIHCSSPHICRTTIACFQLQSAADWDSPLLALNCWIVLLSSSSSIDFIETHVYPLIVILLTWSAWCVFQPRLFNFFCLLILIIICVFLWC